MIAVCLTACTAQVESEGCEDMGREPLDERYNREEHWGAQRPFKPAWIAGQLRTLIQKPPYKMPPDVDAGRPRATYCVPQSQSLLLIAQNMNDGVGTNYVFRWKLDVGQGGARMSVVLDALNTQQIAVAGENIGVDVFCEAFDQTNAATPYTPSLATPTFGATISDGNVTSGAATYTQGFTVAGVSSIDLPVPSMATGWRVDSTDGTATDALVAGVSYLTVGTGGAVGQGLYLGPALKAVQYSSSLIPLPGNTFKIKIQNANATAVAGILQWGLDL